MTDSEREKLRYKEYKARIEVKDSVGTPQSIYTTWRGDLIEDILESAGVHWFRRGNTVIIEIVPTNENFTEGMFSKV